MTDRSTPISAPGATKPEAGQRSIPALLLEQLELGELSPERRAAIEAELARARERGEVDPLADLRASNDEILRDYPSERVVADIRHREARAVRAEGRRASGWAWAVLPFGAAAGVLLWIGLSDDPSGSVGGSDPIARIDDQTPETTRIKGGVNAHLVVDRKLGDGHERLVADELVSPGDRLQVSYVPDGHRQGVIVSIDGRGVVTLHHPSTPDGDPGLAEGKEVPLAESYELDDAPGFERFVLVTVTDEQAIRVDEVIAAAEQLAADPQRARTQPLPLVGERWQQSSILLRKPAAGAGAPVPAGNSEGP